MDILIKIYKRARKYWKFIALGAVTMLLITGVNLVAPGLTRNMIAVLEGDGGSDEKMSQIIVIAIWLLIIYLIRMVLQFVQSYATHYGAWNFVSEIRADIYNHMQGLSVGYYHDKQTGQLMSRVVNDTAAFETLIAHSIPDLVSGILMFTGVSIVLFTTNVTLAALTCIPIPFILVCAPVFKKMRARHKEAQVHIGDLNGMLQDNLSGIKEIQIFNRQDYEFDRVKGHSRKHAKSLLRALWYSALLHPFIGFVSSLGNVIVIGVGGYLALTGVGTDKMAVSDIVGFLLYLSMFYGPVSTLTRIVEDMQSGIAGGERVFEILDTTTDVVEKPEAVKVGRLNGEIVFDDVTFEYDKDTQVFTDVSFKIPPNKMFALVGPTGVGKTTLAALLPRFYDVTSGKISIDGIDIANMTLDSLRSNISMVLQDVFLFNGTIDENIRYGNEESSDEKVRQAAKMACIDDFIESLPEKYETMVGERGVRLSGGQKQRISIARAILRDSPILILDEATSAVDTETEREIQKAITQIAGSRTMIVIAHRLSTVKRADCILVMQDGRLRESGSHDELMAKEGLYKHLVEIQNIKN